MDYHEPYLKMFNACADTIEALNGAICALLQLKENLIAKQRMAEELVITAGEDDGKFWDI